MTIRAVILGLLGAVLLCACTFFNDMVMRGTFLVGNFLPITVYGTLILILLLVNPVLRLFGRRAALTGGELAVAVALVLFACYVPGRGLMHQYSTFLMLPHHYERTTPGWRGELAKVTPEQIRGHTGLVERVTSSFNDSPDSALALLHQHMPKDLPSGRAGTLSNNDVLVALNSLIESPEFSNAVAKGSFALPDHGEILRKKHAEGLEEGEGAILARAAVDVALEGVLTPRRPGVLEHVPPRMLADPSADETQDLDGFVNGLGEGDESIPLNSIPWRAWHRTNLFWVPLIASLCLGIVGLSLVIHRQWSTHERLPYPTVEFAMSLLPGKDSTKSSIFRKPLFWLGVGLVFSLYANNFLCVWWPRLFVRVQLRHNFYPLLEIVPIFRRSGFYIGSMFNPIVYFTVIGFAYFLASDSALSLGIAPYVYAVFCGILTDYGISANGAMLQPYIGSFHYAGGFTAMFLVLVYSGRHYYSSAFRRGIGLASGDEVEPFAVWGMRIFLLGMLAFVIQLTLVGLKWEIAVLYTLVLCIAFVVISRLLAEAGVFYLHTYFFPCAVLWGFFGAKALGPTQVLIMGMLSTVLMIDPREAFMPYVVSALQLVDRSKGKVGRAASFGYLALLLGLAAAIPATIYLQYRHGAIRAGDGWSRGSVPRFAFNASTKVRKTLLAQGDMPVVDQRPGWKRLAQGKPMTACVIGFLTMFAMVILFTVCRHRFAWWPLHPLMFLVLATWQSRVLAFSFLIGWLIKRTVTKYGGAKVYQRLKPFMVGIVAGETLAGIVAMAIGAIYYAVQGEPPKPFSIFR